MAVGLNVDISGEVETLRRLAGLNEIDFVPFFEQAFDDFQFDMDDVFYEEGPGWEPLSPAYAEWKSRVAPGETILRLSSRLYQSLAQESSDSIRDIQDTRARFGTRVPYARFHHRGTSKMPRRHFMKIDRQKLRENLHAFIAKLVGK